MNVNKKELWQNNRFWTALWFFEMFEIERVKEDKIFRIFYELGFAKYIPR